MKVQHANSQRGQNRRSKTKALKVLHPDFCTEMCKFSKNIGGNHHILVMLLSPMMMIVIRAAGHSVLTGRCGNRIKNLQLNL